MPQIKRFSLKLLNFFAALDIDQSFEKGSFFKSLFNNCLQNITFLTVNLDVTE